MKKKIGDIILNVVALIFMAPFILFTFSIVIGIPLVLVYNIGRGIFKIKKEDIYLAVEEHPLGVVFFIIIVCSIITLSVYSYISNLKKKHIEELQSQKFIFLQKEKEYKQTNELTLKEKSKVENINKSLNAVLKTQTPFKEVSSMFSDCMTAIYEKDAIYLEHKPHPAKTAAANIRHIKNVFNEELGGYKEITYKFIFLLDLFPELKNYVFDDNSLIQIKNYTTIDDFNENRDRVKDWISEEEYRKYSVTERNQLALDKYKKREKSDWEIGIEYELYIGYLLREGKFPFDRKYKVIQHGEIRRLNDLGRDIIAERYNDTGERITYVIQCKRWAQQKQIHENAICQLYGTTIMYQIEHGQFLNDSIIPVFVSTTDMSNTATKFANRLKVKVFKIPIGEYPMIKCNINNGERIYHLPFDQQYNRTEITREGEFYAWTVKEAENKGFRRARRWFGQT